MKIDLTPAQADQLLFYVEMADEEGCYFGNRAQFEKRHEAIVAKLKAVAQSDAADRSEGK